MCGLAKRGRPQGLCAVRPAPHRRSYDGGVPERRDAPRVGAMGDGSQLPQDAERRLEIDSALGVLGDLSRSWRPCLSVGLAIRTTATRRTRPDKAILKRIREAWLAKELPKYMGSVISLKGRWSFPVQFCAHHRRPPGLSQLGYYSRGTDFVPRTALDAYPKIKSYIASVKAEPRGAVLCEQMRHAVVVRLLIFTHVCYCI